MNSTLTATTEALAIAGGQPLADGFSDLLPAWPPITELTERRLIDVYRSRSWSFNSSEEQAFCQEFADHHGAKHGIFMVNGTVTLECSLQALGIGAGDEVIMPALTWPATAMAALYVGAVPVFVDVEPTTLCLDATLIEAAITPKTRAIMTVHLYGGMADIEVILEIAKRHNLHVIEDCAHAHGGVWDGKGVGSWGSIGSFSFQQSKTMSSGEGGICITNNDTIAERLYRLKHIGYSPMAAQGKATVGPDADLMCHNYRGTEFQATILREQLQVLKPRLEKYRANAELLEELLRDTPEFRPQSRGRLADIQGYYSWCVIAEGALKDVPIKRLVQAFAAEGLVLNPSYGPVYKHTLWNASADKFRIANGSCPVAEGIAIQNTLTLYHQWLNSEPENIETIARIFKKIAANAGAL